MGEGNPIVRAPPARKSAACHPIDHRSTRLIEKQSIPEPGRPAPKRIATGAIELMINPNPLADTYADFAGNIAGLLEEARHQSARAVNALMTATYWEIG